MQHTRKHSIRPLHQYACSVVLNAAQEEEAPNSEEGPQQRFLYLNEADHEWRFNSENTPDKTEHWASEQTGAAAGLRPLPMGAGMAWSVFTGEVDGKDVFKDMSLTLEPADRSS